MDNDDGFQRWTQPDPVAGPAAGAALLRKAFGLLDIIAAAPGRVVARDLLARSGWPRPTLYRILGALIEEGYVRVDPATQAYTLGYRPIELAQNVWAGSDLAAVASPELRRLRDVTGETAYLAVLQDGAMIALGKFESPHPERSAARLGVRKPLHCTSQGKAALAFLPERAREKLLSQMRLDAYTPHTIVRAQELRRELALIRERGYAIEDQEILLGARCVGAPILDAAGALLGAISVAGPIHRLTVQRAERLGPEMATAARHIGLQLRPADAGRDGSRPPRPSPGQGEPAAYGAAPTWDEGRRTLTWIDARAPRAFEWRDGRCREIAAPQTSSLALHGEPTANGDGETWRARVAKGATAIERMRGAAFEPVATLKAEIGALAWSRGESCLYAADATRGTIHRIDARGDARLFSRVAPVSGEPRGIAVDGEGRLWIALYDGWGLARLSAEGEIDGVVALPAPRPTGLAFGGDDGRMLFVTTACEGVSAQALAHAPHSGLLFELRAP